MNVLNHERITQLVRHRSPLCISLFMPTHRAGHEQQQDIIRLKNLVQQARAKIADRPDAGSLENALREADSLRSDDSFWRHRSDGLACFCAPDFFRAYRTPVKLEEALFLNDRFHIRPLLPLLHSDARLYVLALTQGSARLFETTRFSIREIELPELAPTEVDDDEQSLQYHSHRSMSVGNAGHTGNVANMGGQEAIYHGQGGPDDRTKKDIAKFFQLVDRTVTRKLHGQRSPMVLACVGYLAPIYEAGNHYPTLLKSKVPGSPDRWAEDELRDYAWQLAESHFRRHQEQAWSSFQRGFSAGRATYDLREAVLAADQGRVDTLFLVDGQQRWGRVDSDHQDVEVFEEERQGEELLDYAATRTLSNSGEVFLLDSLPDNSPLAAAFRY